MTTEHTAVSTGIGEIDTVIGALPCGITWLGTRPGAGKTTFLTDILFRAQTDHKVCFLCSSNFSPEEITYRLSIKAANVNAEAWVKDGTLRMEQCRRCTPRTLFRNAKAQKEQHDRLDIIVIDSFQEVFGLATATQKECRRKGGRLTRELRSISQQLDVPILITTQASKRAIFDREITLSSIRDCGCSVTPDDTVILLDNPVYREEDASMFPKIDVKLYLGEHDMVRQTLKLKCRGDTLSFVSAP